MPKFILMRHGQSEWNLHNLFTGWVDIPLSAAGIEEAISGGRQMQHEPVDVIFTSSLIRAQMTAMLAMSVHSSGKVPVLLHRGGDRMEKWGQIYSAAAESQTIPVISAWELNERMYGRLQGVNKTELAEAYGVEQVQIWRRSFDVAPPEGESLAMTAARTIPYLQQQIFPHLDRGQNVFVAAHGNSLRSIIMQLDALTPQEVVALEVPTGVPIIYEYSGGSVRKRNDLPR